MKKLITILFTISLSIAAFCQPNQSFDGMSKREIKQLLIEQEDEQVQGYLQQYTNRKTTGISLLIVSVIAAFLANGKNKRTTKTNGSETFSTSFITASSLSFVIGILLLVTADTSFKKSKDAYLNPSADLSSYHAASSITIP